MLFLSSSIKNLANHSLGKILMFLLLILFTNKLSTSGFADYILFLNLYSLSLLFSSIGIPQYIIRSLSSKDNVSYIKLFLNSIILNIILSSLFSFIIFFVLKISFSINFYFIYFFFIISSINITLLSIFHGLSKVVFADFLDFLIKPTIIFIVIILIYFFNKDLNFTFIFTAFLISQISLFAILCGTILNKLPIRDFYKRDIGNKFEFGLFTKSIIFLGATSFLHIFNSRVDIIMINHFLNKENLAIYGLTLQLVAVLNFPIQAIRSIFHPNLYKYLSIKSYKLANNQLNLIRVGIIYFHIVMIFFAFLLGFLIFPIVFTEKYILSFYLFIFYSFFNLLIIPFLMSEVIMHSFNKEKQIAFITFISAIFNIIFNIIFIPIYGIYGALLITLFCNLIVHASLFFISKRQCNQFSIIKISDFKNFNDYMIYKFKQFK